MELGNRSFWGGGVITKIFSKIHKNATTTLLYYIIRIYIYILNEDTQLVIRAIGVSHTACKDEFRRNLRPHSWSVFSFFIIYMYI